MLNKPNGAKIVVDCWFEETDKFYIWELNGNWYLHT